jgi:hypothetical protein
MGWLCVIAVKMLFMADPIHFEAQVSSPRECYFLWQNYRAANDGRAWIIYLERDW